MGELKGGWAGGSGRDSVKRGGLARTEVNEEKVGGE